MKIRKYLEEKTLLFDGSMGTYFSSVSEDPRYPCEYANITSPNTILEIHNRYLEAGARAIKTNTFALHQNEEYGNEYTVQEMIKQGYELAETAAKPYDAYVFADIGPLTEVEEDKRLKEYYEIINQFLLLGAEYFLFETHAEVEEVNRLAAYIKSHNPESFIMASFAVDQEGFSRSGNWYLDLMNETSMDIDSVGLNCICGPNHMRHLLEKVDVKDKYMSAMPNASYPTVLGHRVSYEKNSHYYAEEIGRIQELGINIVGGCCGTTPEFIRVINTKLELVNVKSPSKRKDMIVKPEQVIKKSPFYEKLKSNKLPIAVELDTPVNTDVREFLEGARILRDLGIDLMTIADCPVARTRIDSSLMACKVKRELGLDVMPHMTCRDRNINASKALLLGLNCEDIRDVLIVTGDPVPSEQRDEVKTVYEFNSRKMTKYITGLNQSIFEHPFYLYAALNINAKNFQVQLRIAKDKIANGTMAFFTQPVLSEQGLENLKLAKRELSVPIVGGILPIVSYRNACFIHNEIPGITVSEEIIASYEGKTREEGTRLGIDISVAFAKKMEPYIDGYYLITPFKRVDIIQEIIQGIRS